MVIQTRFDRDQRVWFRRGSQVCDIVLLAKDNIRLCKENKERGRSLDEAFKKKFGILKENDMEKKKMTKAEAFEYLKGKKVSVSDAEMNERVQSKLFACGVQWKGGGTNFCDYGNYYVINSHGLLGHCDGMVPYWERLVNEEISADDILSIEIVEGTPKFSYEKVVELAKPLMHYLSETRHTEVISVCKEGISAIPMGTFLYKG